MVWVVDVCTGVQQELEDYQIAYYPLAYISFRRRRFREYAPHSRAPA
jgi:hypothetical protein